VTLSAKAHNQAPVPEIEQLYCNLFLQRGLTSSPLCAHEGNAVPNPEQKPGISFCGARTASVFGRDMGMSPECNVT
jgi:hypothetical protein